MHMYTHTYILCTSLRTTCIVRFHVCIRYDTHVDTHGNTHVDTHVYIYIYIYQVYFVTYILLCSLYALLTLEPRTRVCA